MCPQIPAGATFETILFAGNGIVDTILEWGELMRQYHGKTNSFRLSDFSINYLGWVLDVCVCMCERERERGEEGRAGRKREVVGRCLRAYWLQCGLQ